MIKFFREIRQQLLSENKFSKYLTYALGEIIIVVEDISRQEKDLGTQRKKVLDMFRTNENSLKTILKQAGVYDDLGLPKGKNDISNLGLLTSTEFENNMLMFILTSYATEKAHYDPLMQDLDAILNLIHKEIK
jgi:hypothetical protein